ncbi:MAG: helix-turn-helix transcriptional regulator [Nitrospirae bacterium]|nr:helix-turn-helix transcriptional regulator [Nitrospirota bacterium]
MVAQEGSHALVAKVGRRITLARKQTGLTQERLAERAGITQQMLGRTEKARHPGVSLATIFRIASGLGWTVADLLDVAAPEPVLCPCRTRFLGSMEAIDLKLRRLPPLDRRRTEKILHEIVTHVVRAKPDIRPGMLGHLSAACRQTSRTSRTMNED